MYPNRLIRIVCAGIALAFLLRPFPAQATLIDNPPPGFRVIALFTGVRATDTVAVAVHCSNLDKTKTAEVKVEFINFDGTMEGEDSFFIAPGFTSTFTANTDSGDAEFYSEDSKTVLAFALNQGSIRVLSKGTGKVFCSAQVLDAIGDPPSFIQDLPVFSNLGKR